MPFLAVHYILELVWCLWGEHSHPFIYAITDHQLHQYQLLCLGVAGEGRARSSYIPRHPTALHSYRDNPQPPIHLSSLVALRALIYLPVTYHLYDKVSF